MPEQTDYTFLYRSTGASVLFVVSSVFLWWGLCWLAYRGILSWLAVPPVTIPFAFILGFFVPSLLLTRLRPRAFIYRGHARLYPAHIAIDLKYRHYSLPVSRITDIRYGFINKQIGMEIATKTWCYYIEYADGFDRDSLKNFCIAAQTHCARVRADNPR